MSIKIDSIKPDSVVIDEVEEKGLTAVVEEANIKEVVEATEVVQQTEVIVEATEVAPSPVEQEKPKAPARKTAAKGK
jgi:hypothetical protein